MVECRKFKLTLKSANNLPNVRTFGDMKVYAKVSLRGIADTTYQTSVDEAGGTEPKWNTFFEYWLNHSSLEQGGKLIVDIQLYCQRTLGDKYVGEVNINLGKLFGYGVSGTDINYTVKTEDGQPTEGKLELSYTFGDLETVDLTKEKEKSFFGEVGMAVAVELAVEAVSAVVQVMLS